MQVSTRTSLLPHPSPSLGAKHRFLSRISSRSQNERQNQNAQAPEVCSRSSPASQLWAGPSSQIRSPARDRTRRRENALARTEQRRRGGRIQQQQSALQRRCPVRPHRNARKDTARVGNPSGAESRFLWENAFKLRTYCRKSVNYFYDIFRGIFSVNHPLKAAFGCFI